MHPKLLKILVCPPCQVELECAAREVETDGDIVSGTLTCKKCNREYSIVSGIPRFVPMDNYASSFGLQWNLFKSEQLDSHNGFDLSEKRFYSETGWDREWLNDKLILDAGCGAGRFLDVTSKAKVDVVGVDLSNAVDAAKSNTQGRSNVHLVQASIYELPFRPGTFDGVYCLGVVQHTPEPKKTLQCLAEMIKPGGRLGLFIYERKKQTMLYSKYLIRPLTKRLKNETLLTLIKTTMPVLFPLTEVTFRIPVLNRVFQFMIPVSNYVGGNVINNPGLTMKQRYQWALMDTFDMLSPEYDQPQTLQEVEETLNEAGVTNVRRTSRVGLCLDGQKNGNSAKEKGNKA